jgi:hypothetical protein
VVELAIAEIILLTRRLAEKNALMHDGVWDKSAEGAHEVRGRRLGITPVTAPSRRRPVRKPRASVRRREPLANA